jgi:hypothetical protein
MPGGGGLRGGKSRTIAGRRWTNDEMAHIEKAVQILRALSEPNAHWQAFRRLVPRHAHPTITASQVIHEPHASRF